MDVLHLHLRTTVIGIKVAGADRDALCESHPIGDRPLRKSHGSLGRA